MASAKWEGAVVFITGGGSGIGRQLAKDLSRRGAKVTVTDINAEAAAGVAAECGSNATASRLDVTDAVAVAQLIGDTFSKYGRLDYLFNNAGIAVAGEAHEIARPEWDRIIDINIHGVLNGVLAAYPLMIKQGSGHIINTASLAGLGPAPLVSPYAMTKHAIVGLSLSLRLEAEKYGVNVSVLCPSAIDTPIFETKASNWIPDMRRFLTNLAGPPIPVEQFSADAIKAIEANENVIVLPSRAKAAWITGRLFPAVVTLVSRKAVALERADRK
jgi:NAD(P)-dependent dehydrogenase (short-subunit alcohol dehydrogenase family)